MQAVKLIEYDSSFDDAQKKQAKTLKVSCNLNMAACKLKLKDYREVVKLTTKVWVMSSFLCPSYVLVFSLCPSLNMEAFLSVQ